MRLTEVHRLRGLGVVGVKGSKSVWGLGFRGLQKA